MSKRKTKRRLNAWHVSMAAVLFAAVVGFLAWRQLKIYEDGVLEVYAVQQDGYVQLVLDQIELNKDRSNDQIVTDILGTLDASGNRYWTLSQQGAIVFVRDVLESNRYQGFADQTYFGSESAREFVDALNYRKPIHRFIQLGEREFVASGVRFEYKGRDLQICLLTSSEVVLVQNSYLSAKVDLCILVAIELAVFLLSVATLSILAEKWRSRAEKEEADSVALRRTVEELNAVLNEQSVYDTRQVAFQGDVLPQLLQKLERQDTWPVNFILLACDTEQDRERFLTDSQLMLDRRVFRIVLGPRLLLLISVKVQASAEQAAVSALMKSGIQIVGATTIPARPGIPLEQVYREFYQSRVNIYGEQLVP